MRNISERKRVRTSNLVQRWSTKTRITDKRRELQGQKSKSQDHNDSGLCTPPVYYKFHVRRTFLSEDMTHFRSPALVELVTLAFDIWPWNWCALLFVACVTFLPFCVSGVFILDLWANTCETHHVTSRPWPLTLEVMALVSDIGPRAPSVYQFWTS